MQKNYNHKTEDNLYTEWKKSGKMRADNQSEKKSFTIPLPPPNVTGQLHLGHAAMLAIEDIMIRFKKMTDHEVLWIPGTDHAAIATENVVLKHLGAKSREEYSREKFLEHCKSFASEKHDTICHQMEKMGAWLDWSREAYTFDNERNFAVNRMFKMLYEDGLIVRGHRMINWSIGAQSVISDDELEYDDIEEPFYYIKCGEFIVGTVRPETKCANSPVVVHPDSEYVRIKIKSPLPPLSRGSYGNYYKNGNIPYLEGLKERARELRKNQTSAEKIFWDRILKTENFKDLTFLRQKPLDKFIVDFYCSKLGLVIEIDGEIHNKQEEYDQERTSILQEKFGLLILRYSNEEVLNNLEKVKTDFIEKIKEREKIIKTNQLSPLVKGDLGDLKSETYIISKYLTKDKEQFNKVFNLLGEDLKFEILETFRGKDLEGLEFEYDTYAGKRKFHVISDSVIDPHKGSGAMTISCNHSADDYDLGKRLNLEEFFFDKIDMEGKMTDITGPCEGLSVLEARKKSGKLMEEIGLLVGKDKTYEHRVPLCYRSGCVIEPMISPQWFIAVEKEFEDKFTGEKTTLKKQMQEAVRDGHVKIIPQKFEKEYFRWIDNLRDWCISRQIWWGHQIPVWYDENQKIHLPSEKKLVFARHGQSEANANNIFQGSGVDTPLTKKGREQAEKLAENLVKSGQKFDMIIYSDLLRASETAQIVADKLGIESITKWQELREISFGNLEGKPKKEVFGTNTTTFVDEIPFIFDDNLGDKFEDIINRQQKLIEKLKQENKNILVISHETTIATIFAKYKLGERLNRENFKLFAKSFHLENAGKKDISFFAPPATKEQKIIFARHGKTKTLEQKIVQSAGDGLSVDGIKDAEELAKKLKSENITKIISSGYARALETAEIVAKKLNLEVEILDVFHGYDFGDISGTNIDPNKIAAERATEAGTGETISQFWERMKKSWKIIKNVKIEGTLLVVGHRTNLCALDTIRNGGDMEDFLETRREKNNADFGYWGKTEISSLTQDEDTLDTWFSSALWPFSTVGWDGEDRHPDFQKFYPNSVLETGWDILFFWVARMIMFGKYATGKYPFKTVYLHGMVTDEHGKKMSKSKGNGIDPLDMIKDFGADPIRLALVIGSTPGQKIPIGANKIKGYRNFVNKLWNAGRFVQLTINNKQLTINNDLSPKSLAEKWILSRFSSTAKSVKKDLEDYQISNAGDKTYHFVWGEFCDWFIEASKLSQNPEFLASLYREILKLVHPLCPFVTEQIWKDLFEKNELLIEQSFPNINFQDKESVLEFEKIQAIVNEIRSLRAENKLNPKEKLKVFGKIKDTESQKLIENLAGVIFLKRHSELVSESTQKLIIEDIEIVVAIPVDEARQQKEIDNLKKEISALENRLSNKKYVDNAPEKLVNETKNSLKKAKEKLKKFIESSNSNQH